MSAIRWGVLGVAAIALERTLPAMAKTPSARIHAIASRDPGRAQAAVEPFAGARAYGDYAALLADPDIDAVYIPLPNTLHLEWCRRALEAGKHVLCEKPLCLASDDIRRLIETRDRTGRRIEEAFGYRNHPQWTALRGLLVDGVIGRPTAAHGVIAKQFFDPDDIRNNPSRGGGALYDLGSYVISGFHQIFGRPPLRVVGAIDRDPRFGVDRLTSAILDYGDAQATLTVSSQAGGSGWASQQQLFALGSTGWLRADFPYAQARPTACQIEIGEASGAGGLPTRRLTFEPVDQYALQIDRFSRLLLGQDVQSWPIEDALMTLAIIEAVFESAREGGWRAPAAS
jgi:predicted dehydrogenase